jgi:predicted  nucleic acid-binding Zn-ribbon protein
METNSKPLIRPIPRKLARLRRAKDALGGAMREATDRYRRLAQDRTRLNREIAEMRGRKFAWPEESADRENYQSDLKKATDALEQIEDLMADTQAEQAEIKADLQPVLRTVRQLEKYLGIHEDDEYIRTDRYYAEIGGVA